MEGSGASGNEEEAPEDGEGTPLTRYAVDISQKMIYIPDFIMLPFRPS